MIKLENIQSHDDLQLLTADDRVVLCAQIRDFLISHVSKTGGHVASNLGVVELTVAIETVFNTAVDRLVFDVGHQSYIHKMLTGRQAYFNGLRQFGGMAGFPKPSESDTDAFVAGHASSSISIALGMARARTLQKKDYHIIALLGDGAATGGIAYEGLNDAAVSKEPMVIVLNDNTLSIDHNVGGMAYHLRQLRIKRQYLGIKQNTKYYLSKTGAGRFLYRRIHSVKEKIRKLLIPSNIFENIGFSYLGPVDGHDTENLIRLLRIAKDMCSPVVVHVLTQKGRGYLPAQEHPKLFHGIGRFDPVTGIPEQTSKWSFSDSFGEKMVEMAETNHKLCAITAAMPGGTGLLEFKKRFPDRLFDVGIAEEHAVSMAGGLAKQGMIPVVALYSTFLQRSYDMILQDLCMLNLHVVLAVDRAGLVGEDGETHHGVFDVGFLRHAPGLTLLAPSSCAEQQQMLQWAVENHHGVVAIRYPRGGDRCCVDSSWDLQTVVSDGILACHREGDDILLVTYGTLLQNVLDAAQMLSECGIEATVCRFVSLNPLPVSQLTAYMHDNSKVIVVEETGEQCGVCWELSHKLRQILPDCAVFGLNLGSNYVQHGTQNVLYSYYGLDAESIFSYAKEVHQGENKKETGCSFG